MTQQAVLKSAATTPGVAATINEVPRGGLALANGLVIDLHDICALLAAAEVMALADLDDLSIAVENPQSEDYIARLLGKAHRDLQKTTSALSEALDSLRTSPVKVQGVQS